MVTADRNNGSPECRTRGALYTAHPTVESPVSHSQPQLAGPGINKPLEPELSVWLRRANTEYLVCGGNCMAAARSRVCAEAASSTGADRRRPSRELVMVSVISDLWTALLLCARAPDSRMSEYAL